MKEYVFSVMCAALCSGVICVLAPKNKELNKYVSFAVSLAVALILLSPVGGEYDFGNSLFSKNSVHHDSSEYTASAAADVLSSAYGIEKREIVATAEISDEGQTEKITLCTEKYKLPGKKTAEEELSNLFRVKIEIIDKDGREE